ncbi:MAG: hypothetical protein NTW87_02245 [Planctomycetota bacterium]|nr:hypothetical protein [Planctomycetota bacterium]
MRAIVQAADDLDGILNRPLPTSIVFEVLVDTGNRPGALFAAKVEDLRADRV